ncbi:MAG: gamma-glutamyl-gamma-aminobutyrate hydrolase family protein [Planctomycetales bacterium]|jgi:putative glutamine amidotransferase|nr:gamma-glutamyl-gamma-aminobutyrate hydrolase family protein [Planctomycetales bacterium]
MQKKPIVGINGELRPSNKDTVGLSWFNSGYYDSISAAGGLPILLPPYPNDDDLKQALRNVDGVILSGCSMDLDPARMGLEPHPHTRPMPPRREDFDRRMAKAAVEMRLPIIAIGSGMQTLNVVCGGSVYQHVSEEVSRALHHRDPVERHNRHIINIVEGTRCWDIYGPGEIRVNSNHHMAVNRLAPIFRAAAHASDGVIECYESIEESWFCVGVQWHPEDETSSALDMQIFQQFMAACGCSTPQILQMPVRAAA